MVILHTGSLKWLEENKEGDAISREIYCVLSKVTFSVYLTEECLEQERENPQTTVPLISITDLTTEPKIDAKERFILTITWKNFSPEEDRDNCHDENHTKKTSFSDESKAVITTWYEKINEAIASAKT